MTCDTYKHLITLCDTFAEHSNISHWRVSYIVRGDGGFFQRIKNGSGCTVNTAEKVTQWFSNNWPNELDWPRDIPRPEPNEEEAA